MSGITAITVDFDACDPGSTAAIRTHLVQLYNAYMAGISGNQRMRVRHMERWTEYHVGNWNTLRDLYVLLYEQYPEASKGLPRLSPVRGAPAFVRFT